MRKIFGNNICRDEIKTSAYHYCNYVYIDILHRNNLDNY